MKHRNNPIRQQHETELRFSPYAWAKLIFMRDSSENEVGAFGITSADDLLFVEDIVIIKQTVSMVTVAFDDLAVADFFEQQVDLGRKPEQFARIWLHTHPGSSPAPSMTDEETFRRVFGSCNWSVMCIVAQAGKTYARLRFGIGPGGDVPISVSVDYSGEFQASDFKAWKAEYKQNVKEERRHLKSEVSDSELLGGGSNLSEEMIDQLQLMEPYERQEFLDELAVQSEFWDEEMGVFYE